MKMTPESINLTVKLISRIETVTGLITAFRDAKLAYTKIPAPVKEKLLDLADHFLHGYEEETKETSMFDYDLETLKKLKDEL